MWFLDQTFHQPATPHEDDAIIVFTGGSGRVQAGLDLHTDHPNAPLLISGVGVDTQDKDLYNREQHGDNVTLGYGATNTRENIEEMRIWMENLGIGNAVLVTAYYHMPRSLLLAEKFAPSITLRPHPVMPEAEKSPIWQILFVEYHKYIYSWVVM